MAANKRSTLYGWFSNGAIPDGDKFASLIDSSLNLVDDGVTKDTDGTLILTSQGPQQNVLAFGNKDQGTGTVDEDLGSLGAVAPHRQHHRGLSNASAMPRPYDSSSIARPATSASRPPLLGPRLKWRGQ